MRITRTQATLAATALGAALLLAAAPLDAQRPPVRKPSANVESNATPCCDITAIDARARLVTARNAATGESFQFRVTDTMLLRSLTVGQKVYRAEGAQRVGIAPGTPCCGIVAPSGAAAVKSPASSRTPPRRAPVRDARESSKPAVSDMLGVDEIATVFVPFGPITKIDGLSATAHAATQAQSVDFQIPSELNGRVEEGQPVWVAMHQGLVRFVEFPIKVPNTKTVVGKGPGKGTFNVETRDLMVSNTGKISGRTKMLSEDYGSGFTGAVWVRLTDADGNEVHGFEAICIGVNPRSGDEKGWVVTIPKETAVLVRDVELWHMKSSCGRDRVDAFLDDAGKAAEVAGKLAEVYATVKGAGG